MSAILRALHAAADRLENLSKSLLLVLCPAVALGQPFPVPVPGQNGTSTNEQGRSYHTFETPSGSVTYDEQGRSWQTFRTPDGGSVTYDQEGRSWRVYPGPAEQLPHGEER